MNYLWTLVIFAVDMGVFVIVYNLVIMPSLCRTPQIPGYKIDHNFRKISKLRMRYVRFILNVDPCHEFHYLPCSVKDADTIFFDTDLLLSGKRPGAAIRVPFMNVPEGKLRSVSGAALFSAAVSVMLNSVEGEDKRIIRTVIESEGVSVDKFQENCVVSEILTQGRLDSCAVISGGKTLYFYMSCDESVVSLCSRVADGAKTPMTDDMRARLLSGKRTDVSRYYYAMSEAQGENAGVITYLGSIEPFMQPVYDEHIMNSINALEKEGFTVGYVDQAGVYLNSDKYSLDRDVSLVGDSIAFVKEFRGNSPFCCTIKPMKSKKSSADLTDIQDVVSTLISHDSHSEFVRKLIIAVFVAVNFQCALCNVWLPQLLLCLLPMCCFSAFFIKKDVFSPAELSSRKAAVAAVICMAAQLVCRTVTGLLFPLSAKAGAFCWLIGFFPFFGMLISDISSFPIKKTRLLLIPSALLTIAVPIVAFETTFIVPYAIEISCGILCGFIMWPVRGKRQFFC